MRAQCTSFPKTWLGISISTKTWSLTCSLEWRKDLDDNAQSSESLANSLGALVRETGGDGLTTPDYIAAQRPELEWTPLVVGVVAALGRSPFPSIRGPFPVYGDRPFYDARRVENE